MPKNSDFEIFEDQNFCWELTKMKLNKISKENTHKKKKKEQNKTKNT